ncbi:MAG: hypothetical protein KDA57_13060, partial [Planctomycetales bacterium]|nr:hypothetical protein [Planctomycetales bacterium]
VALALHNCDNHSRTELEYGFLASRFIHSNCSRCSFLSQELGPRRARQAQSGKRKAGSREVVAAIDIRAQLVSPGD